MRPSDSLAVRAIEGLPLMMCIARLYEDADNPQPSFRTRTSTNSPMTFASTASCKPSLFTRPMWRVDTAFTSAPSGGAAGQAGLQEVPVVVRDAPADAYTQVAVNRKRHSLTPLGLARFIRGPADGRESNATVAKRRSMNLTTMAHHLALLELPPELDEALKSGRVTSPRTLHELSKLHDEKPEQVRALVVGDAEITRAAVSAMRADRVGFAAEALSTSSSVRRLAQANAACTRLKRARGELSSAPWMASLHLSWSLCVVGLPISPVAGRRSLTVRPHTDSNPAQTERK